MSMVYGSHKKAKHLNVGQKTHKAATASAPWLFRLIFFGFIMMLTCYFFLSLHPSKTTHSKEKYSFTDVKYQDVRSRLTVRNSPNEHTTIEYPITKNATINNYISQSIDQIDQEFQQFLQKSTAELGVFSSQRIGYQIHHKTDKFISLSIHVRQLFGTMQPIQKTLFWTFNLGSGKIVTTDELFAGSIEAKQKLLALAEKNLETQNISPSGLINPNNLSNFIVNDNHLEFPLNTETIADNSRGTITVKLSIDDFESYMNNEAALALFPKLQKRKSEDNPQQLSEKCLKVKCIALTYDDGPGAHTNYLLDILKKYKTNATFFVLGGEAAKYPNVLKRIAQEKHQIGNHSWNHRPLSRLPLEHVRSEITGTNQIISSLSGGVAPKIIRPPYGDTSPEVQAEFAKLGMASILWSIDTRDWADRNSQIICHRAITSARPAAIILMHDIHKTSVEATPCIIEGLKQQGYEFVTIESLFSTLTPGQQYR